MAPNGTKWDPMGPNGIQWDPMGPICLWIPMLFLSFPMDPYGFLWILLIFLCLSYAHPDQFVWGRRRHAHVPFFDMGFDWCVVSPAAVLHIGVLTASGASPPFFTRGG